MEPVQKWECSKCLKTFKTKRYLTRHAITHDPDANVKCEICGQVSKNRRALSAHIWAHHTTKERSCDTCHQMFPSPKNLREHMNSVHSQRRRFPCRFPGCDKTYLNTGHVMEHMETKHPEIIGRFPCTLCIREFRTGLDLEEHMSIHLTEQPFNCATCGMSFVHQAHLKNHEMTHLEKSTPNRSTCHLCPKSFLSLQGLQHHILIVHENQRNYPCGFCGKRFSYASNLKRHVEAKHSTNEDQVHSCDKCEFKTRSHDYLILHGERHEPGNHKCHSCQKIFLSFHELIQHRRINTLERLF